MRILDRISTGRNKEKKRDAKKSNAGKNQNPHATVITLLVTGFYKEKGGGEACFMLRRYTAVVGNDVFILVVIGSRLRYSYYLRTYTSATSMPPYYLMYHERSEMKKQKKKGSAV